MSLHHGTP
uniref:Uncharacterized protein n=1 Tax=Oryza rufipogon TaxID=4529 RepID=A0A0G2KBR3_ORYRU